MWWPQCVHWTCSLHTFGRLSESSQIHSRWPAPSVSFQKYHRRSGEQKTPVFSRNMNQISLLVRQQDYKKTAEQISWEPGWRLGVFSTFFSHFSQCIDLDDNNEACLGGWYPWVSTKGDCRALAEVCALLSAIPLFKKSFNEETAVSWLRLNDKRRVGKVHCNFIVIFLTPCCKTSHIQTSTKQIFSL